MDTIKKQERLRKNTNRKTFIIPLKRKKNNFFSNIFFANKKRITTFALAYEMVVLAQLVRASDCGSEGRRFEPGIPPKHFHILKFYGY